ncbi:hypothetical protein BESB_071790 [Besnoitia besnoiti]|uniref:Uncharacterized protein n=1 Tax=Besnoitia besnoiti TaxID=94643 RepID=A0A2A9MEG8_BESBE|nr:uncharacterized protein BESB_071790 [Besnoitia besnoiti]PFH34027.1 hypothetical protein BESB_071790 [Besnoitia besnoiti]
MWCRRLALPRKGVARRPPSSLASASASLSSSRSSLPLPLSLSRSACLQALAQIPGGAETRLWLASRAFSSAAREAKKASAAAPDGADEAAAALFDSAFSESASPSSSAGGWTLDTGEIVPEAFASAKRVRDFPLLSLSLLLTRLHEKQQDMILAWQAEGGESRSLAANKGRDGPFGGAASLFEQEIARQEEIQRKMKVLQTFSSLADKDGARIADNSRIPSLPHGDAVNLLLWLAAEAETLASSGVSTPPQGTEAAGVCTPQEPSAAETTEAEATEEDSLAEGETQSDGREDTQGADTTSDAGDRLLKQNANLEKWRLCVARLKELALDAEDSFLAFYAMCATNRVDGELLPALLERLEAAYFSTQALSKPLFHPLFEIWDPACDSFAAAVNTLPLSAKALIVQADRRSASARRKAEGWLAPPEAAPLVLPNWQTMQPVDMEAWEKKQRRVVRTRYVKAKVLRQADGRKLAAALALHGRQAVHADAEIASLVAVATMCLPGSQRSLRGELLPETLDILATELLRRSPDALAPHVLALSVALSRAAPFSLAGRAALHLEAAARLWIWKNGFVQTERLRVDEGETDRQQPDALDAAANESRDAEERRQDAVNEQCRNLPLSLRGLEVLETIASSPSVFTAEETAQRDIHQARVLALLLSNFLQMEAYQPALEFVQLLSSALHKTLARAPLPVASASAETPLASSSSASSTRQGVLSLKEVAAVLDDFASAGFEVPRPLLSRLLQHFLVGVDCFLASRPELNDSATLARAFFSSATRGSPQDCARLLHALASSAPGGGGGGGGQAGAETATEETNREELENLRREAITQAWTLIAPILEDVQPHCRLLVFNSLKAAGAPRGVLSTAFFQRSLERFAGDYPDLAPGVLGTHFALRAPAE